MTWRLALFVLLAGTLIAGCSSGGVDGEDPGSSGVPTPSDRAGAPVIREPRDLAARSADPCRTLLTTPQLQELGFDLPGVASVGAIGAPTCSWEAAGASSRRLSVSVARGGDLFVDTYRARALPIFEPHETAGLPAVDSRTFENDPACTTTVGVADGQSLDVDVTRGAREREVDSCAISRRVAEEIVSTLPPLPR